MALSRLRTAEPSARHGHAAVGCGGNLFVWAGNGGPGSRVSSSVLRDLTSSLLLGRSRDRSAASLFLTVCGVWPLPRTGREPFVLVGWMGPKSAI